MKRIVIVGAGFTGAAAAIHLSRSARGPLAISLVDPRAAPGHGLAHSTPHAHHRLNGSAVNHTIYPEAPLHFADWVRDSGTLADDPQALASNGSVYARRFDFGRYMAAEFARHASSNPSGSRLEHVCEIAVRVRRTSTGIEVTLDNGDILAADRCILAMGWNAVGVPGPLRAIADEPGWIGQPSDANRIAALPRQAPVLLMGAGLTASDTFATLHAQGHQGPVLALSRRGLRPASHSRFASKIGSVWAMLRDPSPAFVRRHGPPATIRDALAALRRDIDALDPTTASWHAPFDELRDSVTHFWPHLPSREKQRYVQHVKGWYDAFRFRNPPQVERLVAEGVARDQLRFVAGQVRQARAVDGALEITYEERKTGTSRTLRVAAVINCTGPQPRPSASDNPLWTSMIADGLVRDSPCGVGVDVDTACRTLDASGRPNADLLALGPPTAGTFGEATAVPYVARQILDAMATMLEACRT